MGRNKFFIRKTLLEKIEKNNVTIAFIFCTLKSKKYILLMFQNITQIVKNKLFFNDFKQRKTPS